MILCIAALALFWDKAPDTAPALRKEGIVNIAVPPASLSQWKEVAGITAVALDPAGLVTLPAPNIQYRMADAGATGVPFLNANGWKIQREPGKQYFYNAPGRKAAVAAAEAAAWDATAYVHTDEQGLTWFAGVMRALKALPDEVGSSLANIGLVDDGSPQVGELANLLTRYNLLFRYLPKPDPKLDMNVRLGSESYPAAEAKNPHDLALRIRGDLGDDKRDLRVFGSQVVIGRLTQANGRLRVQLVNYGERPIQGVRVRVRGAYKNSQATGSGVAAPKLVDYAVANGATEFTVELLDTYAAVELTN